MPFSQLFANRSGRGGQVDCVKAMDSCTFRICIIVAGTAHHNKLHARDHVPPPMPRADLSKGISADDKEQRVLRRTRNALNGLDRIALTIGLLKARWFERRVVPARKLNHSVAVFERSPGKIDLVRRLSGRYHQHTVESEALRGFLGNGEMSFMDRVEGPTEDSDPQDYSVSVYIGRRI
jgi:hypothetical protein